MQECLDSAYGNNLDYLKLTFFATLYEKENPTNRRAEFFLQNVIAVSFIRKPPFPVVIQIQAFHNIVFEDDTRMKFVINATPKPMHTQQQRLVRFKYR